MKISFRVVINVGYYAAWFDFEDAEQACIFATNALTHLTPNEDNRKETSISIRVVDLEAEKEKEDEDE